jgi:hypothetical protein
MGSAALEATGFIGFSLFFLFSLLFSHPLIGTGGHKPLSGLDAT